MMADLFQISIDPTNTGQFYACCGLLELADRVYGGAEGWFQQTTFCCRGLNADSRGASLPDLMAMLAHCPLGNVMKPEELRRLEKLSALKKSERALVDGLEDEKKRLESRRREAPIYLPLPFDLRIDWFLDDRSGGSRFKTWAGQQTVIDISQGLHALLTHEVWSSTPPELWLSRSMPSDTLPFNFDSTLSGQGSSLDAGFSYDALGFKAPVRPLLELCAFVGLQRFRPMPDRKDKNLCRFVLWNEPLLPSVAAAAAGGAVQFAGSQWYEFRLLYRTQYLKSFLPAQPRRGALAW
jgi:CRISPR-associated protein Csb3